MVASFCEYLFDDAFINPYLKCNHLLITIMRQAKRAKRLFTWQRVKIANPPLALTSLAKPALFHSCLVYFLALRS